MKQKLVLVWVDNTGFELTGGYRDRLCQYRQTRAIPEAKAVCWSMYSIEQEDRLKKHIEREAKDHDWMGFFVLDYNDDILKVARAKALDEAKSRL